MRRRHCTTASGADSRRKLRLLKTSVFLKGECQIGDVSQRVPHAKKVKRSVRKRKAFADGADEIRARGIARLVEHARAGIEADYVTGLADDMGRAFCD